MTGFLVTWHLWIVYNFMSCSLITGHFTASWHFLFFHVYCLYSIIEGFLGSFSKVQESERSIFRHHWSCASTLTREVKVSLIGFFRTIDSVHVSHWNNIPVCCSATSNFRHLWTSASVLTAFQWCNELKGMSPLKRIRSCHMKCVQEYFICAVYSVRQMYSVMLFMKWIQASHEGTTLKKDHRGTSLALARCHECHGRLLILELVYPCAVCCCVCDD